MADTVTLPATGSGTATPVIATDDVVGVHYQRVKLVDGTLDGTAAIAGDATNGLDVDVTRLPALVAGTANIGDVDVLTIAAGDNNIGNVDIVTMPDATVVGKAADGAAVAGNPVLIAGQDGTLAQSIKTDANGELQVDVLTLPSVTIGTNAALVAGTANIGDVDVLTVPAPLSTTGGGTEAAALRVTLANDSTGLVSVDDNAGSLTVDGTVTANQGGTWTVQPGNTANTTAWLISERPATSGGLTTFHLVGAATTNATVVKASAGQLYGYYLFNANAAMRKLAFHNASTTPTAGASIFFTVPIPAGSAANVTFNSGIAFSTGIAITTVTGFADNDATAIAATDMVLNLWYA